MQVIALMDVDFLQIYVVFDGPQVTYTADTAIVWLSAGSAFKSQAPTDSIVRAD